MEPIRISGMLFPEMGAVFPQGSDHSKSLCFRTFYFLESVNRA